MVPAWRRIGKDEAAHALHLSLPLRQPDPAAPLIARCPSHQLLHIIQDQYVLCAGCVV